MGEPLPLPTFFVIGASKAGTTSLHRYLGLHPQIAVTEPKEPHVMIGPDYRARASWYPRLFAEDRPIRGESSTGYSVAPIQAEVPANIADLVPDARLIYLVRDPIERAIAHYAEALTHGREHRPIEQALRVGGEESRFVNASCYATQLEGYLRHFPDEAILVVDSRSLRERRREVLARILEHVGADSSFWDPDYEREHRVRADDNLKLGSTGLRLSRSRLASAYRRTVPEAARHRVRGRLRRLLGGREIRPQPEAELRDRLAARLAPEAERLRRLTGQPFAGWSV